MRRKTPKMRAVEAEAGRPVELVLIDAINQHGSAAAAAVALGLPYDTVIRWIDALRIDYPVAAARAPEPIA